MPRGLLIQRVYAVDEGREPNNRTFLPSCCVTTVLIRSGCRKYVRAAFWSGEGAPRVEELNAKCQTSCSREHSGTFGSGLTGLHRGSGVGLGLEKVRFSCSRATVGKVGSVVLVGDPADATNWGEVLVGPGGLFLSSQSLVLVCFLNSCC